MPTASSFTVHAHPARHCARCARASRVDSSDLRSLRAVVKDNRPRRAILVCNEQAPRQVEGIDVLPWGEVLARLWEGGIVG